MKKILNQSNLKVLIAGLATAFVLYHSHKKYNLSGISLVLLGVLIVLAFVVVSLMDAKQKQRILSEQLMETRQLLTKDSEGFLRKNEELYQRYKDDFLRLNIISNMIVGYDQKKDYETPLKKMDELNIYRYTRPMKEFYFATKAMLLFKAGKDEEAVRLMNSEEEFFENREEDFSGLGSLFYFDYLKRLAFEGKTEELKKSLSRTRKKMGNNFLADDFPVEDE